MVCRGEGPGFHFSCFNVICFLVGGGGFKSLKPRPFIPKFGASPRGFWWGLRLKIGLRFLQTLGGVGFACGLGLGHVAGRVVNKNPRSP